jgi:hypothetical protein
MVLALAAMVLALAAAPAASQQPERPPGDPFRVFLLGNTGAPDPAALTLTLDALLAQLGTDAERSAVVLLGDVVDCCGIPDSALAGFERARARIRPLIDALGDYPGRLVVVPGDRDWGDVDHGGSTGLERLHDLLDAELDREQSALVPENGFAGPQEIRLTDDIRLIALNTQWLLTDEQKTSGEEGDADSRHAADVFVELGDLIAKRDDERVLVVGHHPVRSRGRYGGHRPPRLHLFPLTDVWSWAYLPLPVIGTFYTGYRRAVGNEQYFAHDRNASMRRGLEGAFALKPGLIYASAHDFSLQHFETENAHYLVSGSASRVEYVSTAGEASFASQDPGFLELDYYDDGSVWLTAWSTEGGIDPLYEARLQRPAPRRPTAVAIEPSALPDYADSTIVVAADPDYESSAVARFFLGSNMRDLWTVETGVPYLDMGREKGGLTPIKRGGGMQTTSIRLQGAEGKQYVLRSIRKNTSVLVPGALKWASGAVYDAMSFTNPHAPFVIPPLAEAVGVHHTNPRLVWVPPDPRLGDYAEVVGNSLMLFEERPHRDMSDAPSFGRSRDVQGAPEMYRRIGRDNDHQVDQRSFLRHRLFDMWMADWDRHEDQWRWATFSGEEGGTTIYRPIPRDRDQAFNQLNGFFAPLLRHASKFQSFRPEYGNVKGLTNNGRDQNHRFLSVLELDDVLEIADSVAAGLTDEVIEGAFRRWPDPVFDLRGEEFIAIGKARREGLRDAAEELYRIHARSVDVVGSAMHERVEVTRVNDDETLLVMYKTNRQGVVRHELYRRVLRREETKEVNVWGLGGIDRFFVSGQGSGIKVRLIGGPGADELTDESTGGRVEFYDSGTENVLRPSPHTRLHISDDPTANRFTGHFYTVEPYPVLNLGANRDDGLVLGAGLGTRRPGFGKVPWGQRHQLALEWHTATGALRAEYEGRRRATLGRWDLGLDAGWWSQRNIRNFYGLGNDTEEIPTDSARVRIGRLYAMVPIELDRGRGGQIRIAPALTRHDVADDSPLASDPDQPGLSAPTLEAQWYGSVFSRVTLAYRDDAINPRQGYDLTVEADGNLGLDGAKDHYGRLGSSLTLWASLLTPRQYTLALRVGGASNFGTFPFWGSNALGGTTNLRGYRATRFSGRSSLFTNLEARVELFGSTTPPVRPSLGFLAFWDGGRVWTTVESSSTWHQGYGGGIWLDVPGLFVLTLSAARSREGTFGYLSSGFFF